MMLVVMAVSMMPIECMVSYWSMVSESMLAEAVIDAVLSVWLVLFPDTVRVAIESVTILEPMRVVLLKPEWVVALPSMWCVVVVLSYVVLNWTTVVG